MLYFRDLSIEQKLKLITMLASSLALLLACGMFIVHDQTSFRRQMVAELSTLGKMVADSSNAALSFRDVTAAREILFALRAKPGIIEAVIYDESGAPFVYFNKDGGGPRLKEMASRVGGHCFDENELVHVQPIHVQGQHIGMLYLSTDLRDLHARLKRYLLIGAGVMVGSLMVAFFLSSVLQRFISAPILHLAQIAGAVSREKNYSIRALVSRFNRKDELGQLTGGFNEMLAQIQHRDEQLMRARDELERRVEERTRALQQEVLERKQAESALARQLARMQLLNRIIVAISERQELQSILSDALRQLEGHIYMDLSALYLADSGGTRLEPAACRSPRGASLKPALHPVAIADLRAAGLGRCLNGRPAFIQDVSAERHPFFQQFAGHELNSLIAVPLMVETKLFGLLFIASARDGTFAEDEKEFLRIFCRQVALAAHNARLYDELRKAYHDLRQSQQTVMQHERLRALGQMASGIAHDINNALSPVVGFAELLQETERNLSPNGGKYLGHIITAGNDIAHIVSRLREFYRAREEDEQLLPVNLNQLAHQVIDLTRPRWRDISLERGIVIRMETDLAPALPLISGIESELREALTNLVFNAIDATPDGGRVTIKTRPGPSIQGAGDAPAPTHVIAEVVDTGVGMNEETRKRCLEPFFSTKGTRGTGLGLAMVYGVMDRHNGRIEIESSPGQGATMRLIFPVYQEAPGGHQARDTEALETAPLKILFVDDEPLLRELMSDVFSNEGHEALMADSGQQGLEMFRAAAAEGKPVDVVITDLGMPHLDGRQLAKAVKAEAPGTPVIMLTGWGAIMKAAGDMPVQVDSVLSKPPKIGKLREALRKATRAKEM